MLFGEAGNDTLQGGLGNDTLNGGAGNDTATLCSMQRRASPSASRPARPPAAPASTAALEHRETRRANFADVLNGSTGNNTLTGGAGNDILNGGAANDNLYGGTGADHFVFSAPGDSPFGTADTISHLQPCRRRSDRCPRHRRHRRGSDDPFIFAGAAFTHHAGPAWPSLTLGANSHQVRGDINGDGVADFAINVHSTTALVAGDFIL